MAPKLGASKRAGTHPCEKSFGAAIPKTETLTKTRLALWKKRRLCKKSPRFCENEDEESRKRRQ